MNTKIVVDRIKVRYTPKHPDSYSAAMALIHSIKSENGKGYKFWQSKYYTQASMPLDLTNTLFLQAGHNHGKNHIWMAFTASTLSLEGWEELYVILGLFLEHGYLTLLQDGVISEVEFAIDVKNAQFDLVHVVDTKLLTLNDFYREDGMLYLGSKKGKRRFAIYDKANQMQQVKGVHHDCHLLRIEARLRDVGVRLCNIAEIENPFTTLHVFGEPNQHEILMKRPTWARYVGRVLNDGVEAQQAYLEAPSGARLVLHTPLYLSRYDWWKPSDLWKQRDTALEIFQPPQYLGGVDKHKCSCT